MANVKISALPAATSVAAADVLPIVQSSTTKKATFTDVAGAVGGVRVYASAAARNSAITSPTEGMCVYLTDEDTLQIYTGSAWVAIGATKTVSGVSEGLVWISNTTIGSAVSSVTVSNCFSSTYDKYKIVWSVNSQSATANAEIYFNNGASQYFNSGFWQAPTSSTVTNYSTGATATSIGIWGVWQGGIAAAHGITEIHSPYLAERTYCVSHGSAPGYMWWSQTQLADTSQNTGFVFRPSTGTITGGTISVYGYRK